MLKRRSKPRMQYRSLSSKRKSSPLALFIFAGVFLLAALVLTLVSLFRFRGKGVFYPNGSRIGNVSVGGLSRDEAETRLEEAFSLPIELRFNQARIQFSPDSFGFAPNINEALKQADEHNPSVSWWRYLWGKPQMLNAFVIPLKHDLNIASIQTALKDTLENRYTYPSTESTPILYSANVLPGEPGLELKNFDETVEKIRLALTSSTERIVELETMEIPPRPMNWQNLETLLRQWIKFEEFNGLVEIYLGDLSDGRVMHFATRNGADVPVDVAYSGASTVKIPIMVSTMRRLSEPLPAQAARWMKTMIQDSLNPPADGLMKAYLDNNRGPLIVTEDLQELGYQNTFMGGFFEPGSPLLRLFETPANTRRDVFLDPDLYNQTVPSEIADLLTRIYRCAQHDSPEFELFGGQVNHSECKIMIENLLSNRMGALIEVGTAVEAKVAHKHGWTNEMDGLLHTMSDVGIVYSPGGDYVLVIFIHSNNQLLFEKGNMLFARLSQSIYNAFNPERQSIVYTE